MFDPFRRCVITSFSSLMVPYKTILMWFFGRNETAQQMSGRMCVTQRSFARSVRKSSHDAEVGKIVRGAYIPSAKGAVANDCCVGHSRSL